MISVDSARLTGSTGRSASARSVADMTITLGGPAVRERDPVPSASAELPWLIGTADAGLMGVDPLTAVLPVLGDILDECRMVVTDAQGRVIEGGRRTAPPHELRGADPRPGDGGGRRRGRRGGPVARGAPDHGGAAPGRGPARRGAPAGAGGRPRGAPPRPGSATPRAPCCPRTGACSRPTRRTGCRPGSGCRPQATGWCCPTAPRPSSHRWTTGGSCVPRRSALKNSALLRDARRSLRAEFFSTLLVSCASISQVKS